MKELLLALPAGQETRGRSFGLTPAHMAYRVGPGPKLLGIRLPPGLRGGLMQVDCAGFDGEGDPVGCCRQILGECRRRSFRGIVCDFEGAPGGCLKKLTEILDRNCAAQGWTLYVPEGYASHAPQARVLIPSALTHGTLERRLRDERLLAWRDDLRAHGVTLFVLSNNRHKTRPRTFSEALGVPWIGHAGKPKTPSFVKAMEQMGVTREQTAIVGDQIFTDVLGGNRAGVSAILVEPIRLAGNPGRYLRYAAEWPFRLLSGKGETL